MVKFLSTLIAFYLIYVMVLFLTQRSLIYLPSQDRADPIDWLVPDMKVVNIETEDGLRLRSWYKAAAQNKPTIVYFQGNADNIRSRGPIARPYLDDGDGVLLLGYRGYGGNGGKSSEEGLYRDGRSAIDFLKKQGVKPQCLVLYGESLGSGVAVQLASEQPVGGVVLQAPFTSFVDIGRYHYPWLPVNWLLKDRYESIKKIAQVTSPKLFLHGEQDTIIPLTFGEQLYQQALHPKKMTIYKMAGHNDMFSHELVKDVQAFIKNEIMC